MSLEFVSHAIWRNKPTPHRASLESPAAWRLVCMQSAFTTAARHSYKNDCSHFPATPIWEEVRFRSVEEVIGFQQWNRFAATPLTWAR
jgi:hypothetical protein